MTRLLISLTKTPYDCRNALMGAALVLESPGWSAVAVPSFAHSSGNDRIGSEDTMSGEWPAEETKNAETR